MCGVSAFGIRLSIFGQKSGSADPRFWGPRLVDVPTEKPRTPKPRSALPKWNSFASLLRCRWFVFYDIFALFGRF